MVMKSPKSSPTPTRESPTTFEANVLSKTEILPEAAAVDANGPADADGDMELAAGLGGLSASMLAAQREADAEVDASEMPSSTTASGAATVDENAELPAMPRLLQLPQRDLVAKTQDLQSKGDQLDLLLLKAESYRYVDRLCGQCLRVWNVCVLCPVSYALSIFLTQTRSHTLYPPPPSASLSWTTSRRASWLPWLNSALRQAALIRKR